MTATSISSTQNPDSADLWSLVEDAATEWPNALMLVSRQGDQCTFSEFRERALRMAAGLDQCGVQRGDVVSWILPTWVDTVVLAAALSRLGAVQNPIIGIYRGRDVEFCVNQTQARFLITPDLFSGTHFAEMGREIAAKHKGLTHLVVDPGAFPSADPAGLGAFAASAGRDVRWVCYTSGTSADPKGAMHADATVGAFDTAMAQCLDVRHGDRYALVFPFPHIGGIGLLFMALRTGCTHLLDAIVDPVATVAFLAENRCTHAGTGTAFFNMYLAAQERRDAALFPNLKACGAGGAPTALRLHRRILRELGAPVVSAWGLTEAPVLTSNRLGDPVDRMETTEGRALPGVEIRVVDDNDVECATGAQGELRVRGPQLMLGYQDPTLDRDAFDALGYFRTGDLGAIDHDGYVTITGRAKDVIIRNGENIAAREVEDLLLSVDGIVDAAVIGLADDRTGESVCAVIVTSATPPTLEELHATLTSAGLRKQALPTRLDVRAMLPRNPAGKVLKRQLVDELLRTD